MSLLDTFLEEGLLESSLPKPLKEVWLAIRTDGPTDSETPLIFGNGTCENPFDASTADKFVRMCCCRFSLEESAMKWLMNESPRSWVWARCFAWVAVMVLLAAQQSRGAETNTIVIPPGAANEEGGSYGGPFSGPFEYQLAYHGSLFSPITSRIEITGVAWRVDGQGVGASFEVVVPRFEVWASTFQSPLSELSHIRAENWGADRINVFTGENVRFVGTGGSSPNSFDVKVVFDRPFPYEPGSGALLLDVESSGSFSKFAAAIDIGGDSLVAILGDDAFGPIIIHGAADVLEISYVPEPAVWVLVIVGLIPGCAGVGGRGSGYGAAGSRRVL